MTKLDDEALQTLITQTITAINIVSEKNIIRDQTIPGVIIDCLGNSLYNVQIKNDTYKIPYYNDNLTFTCDGKEFVLKAKISVGDKVWVLKPCGSTLDMFILGRRK